MQMSYTYICFFTLIHNQVSIINYFNCANGYSIVIQYNSPILKNAYWTFTLCYFYIIILYDSPSVYTHNGQLHYVYYKLIGIRYIGARIDITAI